MDQAGLMKWSFLEDASFTPTPHPGAKMAAAQIWTSSKGYEPWLISAAPWFHPNCMEGPFNTHTPIAVYSSKVKLKSNNIQLLLQAFSPEVGKSLTASAPRQLPVSHYCSTPAIPRAAKQVLRTAPLLISPSSVCHGIIITAGKEMMLFSSSWWLFKAKKKKKGKKRKCVNFQSAKYLRGSSKEREVNTSEFSWVWLERDWLYSILPSINSGFSLRQPHFPKDLSTHPFWAERNTTYYIVSYHWFCFGACPERK